MRYTLINATMMARKHPETFGLPSPQHLKTLQSGDLVKIGVQFDPKVKSGEEPPQRVLWAAKIGENAANAVDAERFWVKLSHVGALDMVGVVANDLVYTAHHGMQFEDTITVRRKNVLDILP